MIHLPRLYGVTDEALLPSAVLVERVRDAVEAGLGMVQVRFKATPAQERLWLGRALRLVTAENDALLIVNDDPKLAAELSADGVHVGAEDVSVERARDTLGPDAIVGMSAYDDGKLVRESVTRGVSYIGLSSPWPSPTKDKSSPTPEVLAALARTSPVPAYAIGGIGIERATEMVRLGCHGVAVVSSLFGAEDVGEAVRRFREALDEGEPTNAGEDALPGHDLRLETARLVLRPCEPADFDIAVRFYQDREFRDLFEGDREVKITREWLVDVAKAMARQGWYFTIEERESGQAIGEVCLQWMNLERAAVRPGEKVMRMPIGIWDKALWRKGYGREIVEALLDRAFRVERIDRLCAMGVDRDNVRSRGLFKALGLRVVREVPAEDAVDLEITREEFERIHAND